MTTRRTTRASNSKTSNKPPPLPGGGLPIAKREPVPKHLRRSSREKVAVPFTVPHFRAWASELVLDNGEPWIFEHFLEDYLAGIPECWLLVPEGNTKTTSVAGLCGYLLEFRPSAAIPWAASSRDQAEIGYRQLEGLILRSPSRTWRS